MTLPDNIDEQKLAETALAILWLGAHGYPNDPKVWKSMDWDLTDLLHKKGWIDNPIGKQKSVALTNAGQELAEHFFKKHFGAKS